VSPICIRIVDGKPRLVFGRHRLAAAKKLDWPKIDCQVIEADDLQAEMIEIAENLHRAELSVLERAEQIARWARLAKERDAPKAQLAPSHTGGRPDEGINAAVRDLGIERTAVQRAMKIDALPDEVKAEAKALRLDDNQSAMLAAAKATDPAASLLQHAQRRRSTPEELAEKKADREARERYKEEKRRREEEWEASAKAAATMLIGYLPERLTEWVRHIHVLHYDFLHKDDLGVALHRLCPDLCESCREAEAMESDSDRSAANASPAPAAEASSAATASESADIGAVYRALTVEERKWSWEWTDAGCPNLLTYSVEPSLSPDLVA